MQCYAVRPQEKGFAAQAAQDQVYNYALSGRLIDCCWHCYNAIAPVAADGDPWQPLAVRKHTRTRTLCTDKTQVVEMGRFVARPRRVIV